MEPIKAWWFEPTDGLLGYGDGRKPEIGVTHDVRCTPKVCERGLHASVRALDALQHAQSSIVWRVEISGDVVHGRDKIAGSRRTYIARIDATEILRVFARQCALDVAHLWEMPAVVREYMETGKEELRAAARNAASAAASAAALDAAWAAASYAASAAALAAASAAALEAARASARDAAWAAARDAQSYRLESALLAQISES